MNAKKEDLLKWALNICNEIQSIKTYANRFPETASLGVAIEDYFIHQLRLSKEKTELVCHEVKEDDLQIGEEYILKYNKAKLTRVDEDAKSWDVKDDNRIILKPTAPGYH